MVEVLLMKPWSKALLVAEAQVPLKHMSGEAGAAALSTAPEEVAVERSHLPPNFQHRRNILFAK